MQALRLFNLIISLVFFLCYAYQLLYAVLPLLRREKPLPPGRGEHELAVLICARNEEAVVGDLLDSLRAQTYPREKLHVFVLADGCTDGTAAVARAAGAAVYIRNEPERVGKGYALEFLMSRIREDFPRGFDAYLVFDADNLLEPDYVEQMDRSFSSGFEVVTGYRNSKNYGTNWISAGYALWFLRESRYLNHARHLLGVSCAVSGTGFLFSRAVAEEQGGWPFHLLTEDVEFAVARILRGRRIGFCASAELYDEQPETFSQSWRQRLRWARGYLQVFRRYGGGLLKGILKGSFACFDVTVNVFPVIILTVVSLGINLAAGLLAALRGAPAAFAFRSAALGLGNGLLVLFLRGLWTTVTEWKHIRASAGRKLLAVFTFPFFMLTYLPVSAAALFVNPGWKPIRHTVTAEDFRKSGRGPRPKSFPLRSVANEAVDNR